MFFSTYYRNPDEDKPKRTEIGKISPVVLYLILVQYLTGAAEFRLFPMNIIYHTLSKQASVILRH